MATIEVDIDDGLVDTLRRHLPPGWTVDDWLSLKSEEAIAQMHLDQRRQSIQQDAQQAAHAAAVDAGPPRTVTYDDVQQAQQTAADGGQPADDDTHD